MSFGDDLAASLRAEVNRLTREHFEERCRVARLQRKLGELQGQLEASEWHGVIEGWRRKVEEAEEERDRLRDAIREHRGAERLCQDPEDFDLRLWAAVPGLTEEAT